MIYFWLILCVLFLIIEFATPQLTTIWFALSAFIAFLLAMFSADLWIQIVVFIVISVILLLLTRPLAKKIISKGFEPTNADRLIGETAIVTEAIDNDCALGTVKIFGQIWNARSNSGELIPIGEKVTVKAISGSKLIVDLNK